MDINIKDLFKVNGSIKHIHIDIPTEWIEVAQEKIEVENGFKLEGDFVNLNRVADFNGTLEGVLKVICHSCGKDFKYNMKIDISETFASNSKEEDIYPIEDGVVDFTKVIQDNLELQLPTKFLCKPDCKGVCTICGKDKNIEICNCEEEKTDPRFEILKHLFD